MPSLESQQTGRATLTIPLVADNPSLLKRLVLNSTGDIFVFRPAERSDVQGLTGFLESLSQDTRVFWRRTSYDLAEAQEICTAIGSYDKLRMVVSDSNDQGKGARSCGV